MSPEQQTQFEQLRSTVEQMQVAVEEMRSFVSEKKNQQLSYPLDYASRQIVQIDALLIGGAKETSGAPYTNDGYIPVVVNGQRIFLMTTT